MRHKTRSNFTDITELPALVTSHNERIEWIAGSVSADDKFLRTVKVVFKPGATAPARLVKRTFALGDHALKLKFLRCPDELARLNIKRG